VFLGLDPDHALWLGIQPLLAGVFGVPVGFAATVGVSLWARSRRSLAVTS
jgi:cation/acetate symporter